MVKSTWSLLGGILGPTSPLLTDRSRPRSRSLLLGAVQLRGLLQEYTFFKAKSCNIENRLATFPAHLVENSWRGRIQYNLLYPCARGLSAPGGAPGLRRDQRLARRRLSNSRRTDGAECRTPSSEQRNSNHFTPKLPTRPRITIPRAHERYTADVMLESACTSILHYIPCAMHIKQAIL